MDVSLWLKKKRKQCRLSGEVFLSPLDIAELFEGLADKSITPALYSCGLCANTELPITYLSPDIAEPFADWLQALRPQWPGGTGFPAYVVPHPRLSAVEAYSVATVPKWEGVYGDNRRALARWLAERIRARYGAE